MSRGLKNEKQIFSLSEERNRVSHVSLLSHFFFGAQDQACAESWTADASVESTTPGAVWSPAPTPMGSALAVSPVLVPNSSVLAFNCSVTELKAPLSLVQHLRSLGLCGHPIQAHSYPLPGSLTRANLNSPCFSLHMPHPKRYVGARAPANQTQSHPTCRGHVASWEGSELLLAVRRLCHFRNLQLPLAVARSTILSHWRIRKVRGQGPVARRRPRCSMLTASWKELMLSCPI